MAFPPPVPPATRTNATPDVDNHPSDHNLVSAALTEIINHFAVVEQVGRLSSSYDGTSQVGIQQTPVVLSGTSLTYTVPAGRHVFITAKVNYNKAPADSKAQCVAILTHDGTQIDIASANIEAPGDESLFLLGEVLPTAGTHTVLLQGYTTAGFVNAKERKIIVEDAGKVAP